MEDNDNYLTEVIIGCAYTVSNTLGTGFLEKIYENAMVIELKKQELSVKQQKAINVKYEGYSIGDYFADLFVEEKVIVELKVSK